VLLLSTTEAVGTQSDLEPLFAGWETIGTDEGLPSAKVFSVLVDGDRVWAGTEGGLALLENGGVRTFGRSEGLPFPVVTALAQSALTGDLWIGTMGGLARLSAGRIDAFTQLNSGLVNDVIYGVAVDGADVWVATAAGLSRYNTRDNTWEIFDISNTLMNEPWCYAVTAAESGIYVAVWGGGVVIRERASGRFREHRDPDGEMEIDLFRDDGLVHDVTSSVAVSGGVMWVGTYFGLSRYDGRHWNSYSEQDSGLAGDFINSLASDGDVVWIATDQGLSRFDFKSWHTWKHSGPRGFEHRNTSASGVVRSIRRETGPASDTIFGIAIDGDDIWLATAAGLSHGIGRHRDRADPSTNQGRQAEEHGEQIAEQ
jgi:ligand-binding sensor domain-containing protein